MMSLSIKLTCGLQQSLSSFWKNDNFTDFTVVVDGTSFQCHRLILGACSEFFQCLFRSQMKECQENCATIGGMSSGTFEVILNSLYTGMDGLTKDNFLNVWSATEQLQIRYLTEECTNFAIKNTCVDNVFNILNYASMFSRENVVTDCLHFITEHFEKVRNTEEFLLLPYDYLYRVISSDNLNTNCENEVLEAAIKWVEHGNSIHALPQLDSSNDNIRIDNVNINSIETADSAICSQVTTSNTSNDGSTQLNRSFIIRVNDENSMDGNSVTSPCQVAPSESQTEMNGDQSTILTGTKNNQTGRLECIKETHINTLAVTIPGMCRRGSQNSNFCENKDRRQYLLKLVSACRLYLISSKFLNKILHNRLVVSCEETYNLLLNTMMYKLCVERRHETWPDYAVHRIPSKMKHVMVYCSSGKLKAYNLNCGTIHEIIKTPEDNITPSIGVFDNSLFNDFDSESELRMLHVLTKEKFWKSVTSKQDVNKLCKLRTLLAHGSYLYSVYQNPANNYTFECYNCKYVLSKRRSLCYDLKNTKVNLLVRFHKYVLIFYNKNDCVTALCYNTKNKKMLDSSAVMDGTSQDMVNFSHQGNVFVLQRNGSLWKILYTDGNKGDDDDDDINDDDLNEDVSDEDVSDEDVSDEDVSYEDENIEDVSDDSHDDKVLIDFELVTKLFDFICELRGCVVYKDHLYVFYKGKQKIDAGLTSLPGIVTNIHYVQVESDTNCLPMIVPAKWLTVQK